MTADSSRSLKNHLQLSAESAELLATTCYHHKVLVVHTQASITCSLLQSWPTPTQHNTAHQSPTASIVTSHCTASG
jgi:hypothetical protein